MLNRYGRWFQVGGITAVMLGILSAVFFAATQVSADPQIPRPQVIKDVGAWKVEHLRVVEQANGVSRNAAAGMVHFDTGSKASIIAYRDAVQKEGQAAFAKTSTVPALITFAKPLTTDRFVELMTASGIQVKSFQIRTLTATGQRAVISGAPDEKLMLDPSHVARFLTGGPSQRNDVLQGVIVAEGLVNRANYDTLSKNVQEVFLVDIMRAIAHAELVKAGITDLPMDRIYVTSPYWQMEDHGIVTR